jgi:hypothetical protein
MNPRRGCIINENGEVVAAWEYNDPDITEFVLPIQPESNHTVVDLGEDFDPEKDMEQLYESVRQKTARIRMTGAGYEIKELVNKDNPGLGERKHPLQMKLEERRKQKLPPPAEPPADLPDETKA